MLAGDQRRHVVRFNVVDTQKIQADVFGHHGTVESGTLAVGDMVQAASMRRRANASATITRPRT